MKSRTIARTSRFPTSGAGKREELTISRMMLGIAIPVLFFAGLGITALIIFLKNLKSPDSRGDSVAAIVALGVLGIRRIHRDLRAREIGFRHFLRHTTRRFRSKHFSGRLRSEQFSVDRFISD